MLSFECIDRFWSDLAFTELNVCAKRIYAFSRFRDITPQCNKKLEHIVTSFYIDKKNEKNIRWKKKWYLLLLSSSQRCSKRRLIMFFTLWKLSSRLKVKDDILKTLESDGKIPYKPTDVEEIVSDVIHGRKSSSSPCSCEEDSPRRNRRISKRR